MLSRVFAAAFAATLAFGAGIAPVCAAARGSAVGIGGGGFFHSGMRHFSHVGTPRIHRVGPGFAHPGFRHTGHVLPPASSSAAVLHIQFPRGAFRHRHFVRGGFPITVWEGTAFYGSYYDPSDDDVLYTGTLPDDPSTAGPPADAGPAAVGRVPVGFVRAGCRSQDVTVLASNGGERTITVTRC